ncbi:MAG: methyltransferase domain-containing protein [Clostridiales bacterium]|nr:methyltransferase domain-containing protein [Clostridiales bacterium]
MEFRKVFDTIPDKFDKYRVRYSQELFDSLIKYAGIGPAKTVLELGPGTGQATDPILNTGCDYNAIELGENLYQKMKEKYGDKENFHIVNDDFITHDFEGQKFDMIYSAATIQWIPEDVAFSKTFELLKPGGTLAMILLYGDYRCTNEDLYQKIQKIYDEYFKPEIKYPHSGFKYDNAVNFGYTDFQRKEFYGTREMDADEYVNFCGTHCDHLVIPEPYKTKFYEGLRTTVMENGNKVVFKDTYILYLAKKPEELT